jgi:acyl-CoA oxidase
MDSRALAHRLEGDAYEPSRKYRHLLSKEPFIRNTGLTFVEHQKAVEDWCRWFADHGYGKLGLPPSLGGDPFRFNCLAYELGLFDYNLMMRFGLQFGFVLRAVARLGSSGQLSWLDKITTMQSSACLAMTETGHGSHVRGLQTTATFYPETQEFTLNTPNAAAAKDYVTAVRFADLCLVFARLESLGQQHGVHAFLVPLRDESGTLSPSVSVEDCGLMGGLNGLDYSRLTFRNMTLPKLSMLNRHAHLEQDGSYHRKLKSESNRFNAMMGTLVVGRSLITGGAAGGAKTCLSIAIRYAGRRRQFSANEQELERTVLSYQAVQARLMPALARILAIDAGISRLAQCQHEYFEDSVKDRELETFTGALKSYTSGFAIEAAQLSRQTCGGAGCLAANRLTEIRKDLDLFTTMEGDNTVLDLMVARNLLVDFRRGLDQSKVLKALSWVGQSVNLAAQTNPLKSRDASSEKITSQEFLTGALRFRKDRLRYSLGRRVHARVTDGLSLFDALNDCQAHCLSLSVAYCEDKIYRCLRNLMESCPPGWDRRVMTHTLNLFALSRLEADKGWFLEQGYLKPRQSQAVRNEVLQLSSTLAQESQMIVDAFEISPKLLGTDLLNVGEDAP